MKRNIVRASQFLSGGLLIGCCLSSCSDRGNGSEAALLNEELLCPEPAVAQFEPWGKSGSQKICKVKHGPFVAWESGYVHVRGQYDNGTKAGVWRWFDKDGNVTKEIDYSQPGTAHGSDIRN